VPALPTFPTLVGGRLHRAAVGRGRPVHDAAGVLLGFSTSASPGDVAQAVAAARGALPAWAAATAVERGRVLFGVAELLDERPDDTAAADRWLWYAGWADKIAELLGAGQLVDGAASWAAPRPVGVVGVLAPASGPGLVDLIAPVLAAGATAVVVAPHEQPQAAAALAEVLAAAELPAGVANVLTGDVDGLVDGLAPALARAGVDGLDPGDRPPDTVADAVARGVRMPPPGARDAGIARLRTWSTVTTVWHPAGR
jgi:acyl-CoA reductase-like NAD-dependent aldehyde dehydrogenase